MIEFICYIDQTILFFIQSTLHYTILDRIMIGVTILGDKGLVWLVIAFAFIINKKTRHIGVLTLFALIFATIMGEGILKHLIQRQRPYADFPLIQLVINKSTAYSFPSGHSTSSFAAAYILSKYFKKLSIEFWAMACIIAFSRLYLFMHYPSDIVAGIILGLFCGKIVSLIYDERKKI